MKFKSYLLKMLFCFAAFTGTAQIEDNLSYLWHSLPGDTLYIYNNIAYVREVPDISSAIQDSLKCGTVVIAQEQTKDPVNIRGINVPWIKVKYLSQAIIKEGYIWLGSLALGHCSKRGIHFLYGIEKITKATSTSEKYTPSNSYLKIKVLDDAGQFLEEKELTHDLHLISDSKLLGNMGLKNTIDILRINLGGEACGIATDYYYYGWTGKKLLTLPKKMTVGDGDVYYHDEVLLFPKEKGGQPNKIIKLIEKGESLEKVDKNGNTIYKIKKSKETYVWNGNKAIKVKN